MKHQTCLVTGGAGFIGSHIVDALVRKGFRVRVLDDFSRGKMENLELSRRHVKVIEGDVRSLKTVSAAVKGAACVFHLAAIASVPQSCADPLEAHEVNVTGTLNVLLAARDAGVKRVVFTSSSAIYGDTRKFPTREDERPMPESPYAASKIMGEYYCRNFTRLYGLETVSLRYFNVFGPRQDPKSQYSNVIPIFIRKMKRGETVTVHWDGKQSRDFVHIDNVVSANLIAMRKPGVAGESFNVGCFEEKSILEIVRDLKACLGIRNVVTEFGPKRAGDVRRTLADISKAKKKLGYRPVMFFKKGLQSTVRWFLDHPEAL
ncbi:MAG TPA: SDR family oxidoreductase [Candidatus Omnitrophota bacterium]|jgi:UDP-glucose 4-epimerase|nr:MAG: UDP-glucose 4-epimerase [Candidatus Omnitrophica bacterium ADurb.Bin314]HOE68526.1 SDR family oxidoreductase [Candidatus Omnitrophota bacterium]HPW64577.1 SDR family oxidoreductase [Candidatus Omnitrophota bacterium]HQB94316.1 SDR family oxidoreductase [Candidatus Omnitrophota bacterium]